MYTNFQQKYIQGLQGQSTLRHYNGSAISSGNLLLNGAVYIADADPIINGILLCLPRTR